MERSPFESEPPSGALPLSDAELRLDPLLVEPVVAAPTSFAPELERQRRIATDLEQPLADRLEAFEDIFDSEVGDTTLARARNIERKLGPRQLFLKFEGGNPTGTQKDRIAFAQVLDALRRGYSAITVATCGNYGAAIVAAAATAGLRALVYVPEAYHSRRIDEIRRRGAEIIPVPGDYEQAVVVSRQCASDSDDVYDGNPGGSNTPMQLDAYGQIANEIYDELRDAPAAVAVPVSNGTTLAGIHKGFLRLYRRGRTSRMPRIVAGSSHGKNPIVRAFVKGLQTCEDLVPSRVRGTATNEPLVNWHSIDGDLALEGLHATHGWAADASDRAMRSLAAEVRTAEGLAVLPASTAGLLALLEGHRKKPLPPDRYVAVLTGRRG